MMKAERMNHKIENNRLFVISDLHIGNGSARDNLLKNNKLTVFQRFLDEVDRHDGVLIILGDLLELWRYRGEDILERWDRLLRRLAEMDLIYVPGNHDPLWSDTYTSVRQMHPLFDKLHRPFIKDIGGRRFKFMHGHELDPLITPGIQKFSPILCWLSGVLEYRQDMCLMTSNVLTDVLEEAGEQVLRLWKKLTLQINSSGFEHLGLADETMTQLIRPIRTRNMLGRVLKEQREGLYDVTITGHTHKAGCYEQWYFNCGCWTRTVTNYLTIDTDGLIHVFDWTSNGAESNTAVVM